MAAGSAPRQARLRGLALCAGLIVANFAVWGWAWTTFHGNAVLLGTALLAYVFGLRHAVDADHIAAIDNATRKLVEAGRPAAATGLYFSLGHASVVVLLSLAIALTTAGLQASLADWKPLASTVATCLSAGTLLALALANCVILLSIGRLLTAVRRGSQPDNTELQQMLARRGILGRLLRRLFGLISKSWHMYPLGFLFGLGFDTATEIAVLGISAAQASHGLPLSAIMVFPALFAAGMALVDTADALLMAGAYRWASVEPLRKLYYNLVITLFSVVVAVAIGGVQLLGLVAGEAGTAGGMSQLATYLGDHSAAIGSGIIAVFVATWLVSVLIWRTRSAPS